MAKHKSILTVVLALVLSCLMWQSAMARRNVCNEKCNALVNGSGQTVGWACLTGHEGTECLATISTCSINITGCNETFLSNTVGVLASREQISSCRPIGVGASGSQRIARG